MITIKDFKRVDTGDGKHYLSHRSGEFEICLEPCLSGYCVGIYREGPDERIVGLVTEKKCTDFKFKRPGLSFGVDGLKKGEANMVVLRAVKYANEFKSNFIK